MPDGKTYIRQPSDAQRQLAALRARIIDQFQSANAALRLSEVQPDHDRDQVWIVMGDLIKSGKIVLGGGCYTWVNSDGE